MNKYLYLIEAGSAVQAIDIAHSHGLKKHEWKYVTFKTPLRGPFNLPYGYREHSIVKLKFRKSEKYTLDIAIENWHAEVQEIYKSMETEKSKTIEEKFDELPESVKEKYFDQVRNTLDGFLWCNRVWEAWTVGTMSEDDFSPAGDDEDVIREHAVNMFKLFKELDK